MSLILGIKTNSVIVIAGDRRCALSDGTFTDNNDKVFMVNTQLAIACAGNQAFVNGISKKLIESSGKDEMITETLLEIAQSEYNMTKAACMLRKQFDKNFEDSSNSCCCFIAGLNKSNNPTLIFAYDENDRGYLTAFEVDKMITPPLDMTAKKCFELLDKNYNKNPIDFTSETFGDIAKLSKFVSETGVKWIYDFNTKQGILQMF